MLYLQVYLFDILDGNEIKYDQIPVDGDTIVHHDCPNFFDMSDKYVGVHNEGSYDWILGYRNYSKYIFVVR